MDIICNWCKKLFISEKNLKTHMETAKYCMAIRGEIEKRTFECEYCQCTFISNSSKVRHIKCCLKKPLTKSVINYKNQREEDTNVITRLNNEICDLKNNVDIYESKIKKLTDDLHKKDKKIMLLKTEYELTLSHTSKGTNINFQTNNKTKKKSKTTIPPKLKENVWRTYVGEIISIQCPVCELNKITCFSFDCGHVIAESNEGILELSNLRPICGSCNSSMGIKNMQDYAKEFYPHSPILLTF